jgi:hypothetical protein
MEAPRTHDDVWLHFDAKYRANRVEELVGESGDEPVLVAKTEDLYKMHTYRDAIIHAVGAYVVFPGTQDLKRQQYGEVLPGLGAFPLRPSGDGATLGAEELRNFLRQAFDHVATQTTKHERLRYWRRTATEDPGGAAAQDAVHFLEKPPADTLILLGYVKNANHHDWIVRTGLYNLRADKDRRGGVGLRSSELSVELVALYGRIGDQPTLFRVTDEPRVVTTTDLLELGYPSPGGQLYFCLPVAPVDSLPTWWAVERTARVAESTEPARPRGAPIVTSWRRIVEGA